MTGRFGARSRVTTQVGTWLPQATLSPLDLRPALWLDASDTSTITSSGSPAKVSQLADKSGNGRDFTQSTAASQPTTGSNTQNNLNVILFDGSDDYLEILTNELLKNVSGATLYLAMSHVVSPTSTTLPFGISADIAAARLAVNSGATSGKWSGGGRRTNTDSFVGVTSTTSITADAFFGQVLVYDYANSDLYQFIGNTAEGSTTSFQTDGKTVNALAAAARIGTTSVGSPPTAGFANIKLGEIILYQSAHSAADRTRVMAYLSMKWGFAI